MKICFNLRHVPAFLVLLCVMDSYGQVMSTDTSHQSTTPGYATQQDFPSELTLSTTDRLSVVTHKGEVVLNTGVRLRGCLHYQPLTNTLRVREVNTWRTYPADQIRHVSYIDQTGNQAHHITAFPVPSALGEIRTLLLEELVPGAIPLLQLPLLNSQYGTTLQELPQARAANWRTKQPCYVWFDGRLLTPDVFVRTEIDALLTIVPESVQYWAASYPRPTCLPELARWLSAFGRELARVQPNPSAFSPGQPHVRPVPVPPCIDSFGLLDKRLIKSRYRRLLLRSSGTVDYSNRVLAQKKWYFV